MAETKKPAAKKPAAKKEEAPVLLFDEGYWWIVTGTKRMNVGRSERYAQKMFADLGNG